MTESERKLKVLLDNLVNESKKDEILIERRWCAHCCEEKGASRHVSYELEISKSSRGDNSTILLAGSVT